DLYRERYFDELLDTATRKELETELRERLLHANGENVFISAKSKEGVEELRERMTRLIKESYVVRYPHQVKGW
ncbi:MAG: GTPase HflX, partial [Thermoanaerobaculia bacterium]|nr:GTPase HflX [Thermoanaerobaculia bacterium]